MHGSELRVPLTKVAFDHPETRSEWKATRRRVRLKLSLWSVLLVGALTLCGLLAEVRWAAPTARSDNSVGGLIGGVGILGYVFALYTCCGALSRLRKARSILEAYPWRRFPAVRRLSGKDPAGVPVQFRLAERGEEPGRGDSSSADDVYVDDDGTVWSQSMSARNPLRWNRWNESMERGAWYAGDVAIGGVLALPGGSGLMTVQRRMQVLSMDRQPGRTDHERILAAAPGRD
ncbi:hypothetical protein HCC61_28645 [Streptomyces sp. HNM0575]|uniref:hypothetical protein n=1 Tax=Streptomyces sp. HNM0575 TaxID=2716338 RepID=UPI00145C5353|nr:hypothetical protein [Streptomyces sp. HNM0575]NLU76546.1 hypothetical protein [Streptomyces sp. HNM0575]